MGVIQIGTTVENLLLSQISHCMMTALANQFHLMLPKADAKKGHRCLWLPHDILKFKYIHFHL